MNCGNITIEDINCVGEMISETQVATDNGEGEDSPHPTQQLTSTTSESLPPQTTSQQTTTISTNNLATEHGIFLRAILDLLNQRDQIALESDINSQNTIKVGTLRKASHRMKGKWKTKYVELRRGTFSYYTDTSTSSNKKQSNLKRNDIQLHASKCTCQSVTIHSVKILSSSKTNGTVFEIKVQNGKRRLWMTNTIEECKSWIQAIHNAMIGASVVRGDNFLEYSTREQSKKKMGRDNNIHVPTNSPYKSYLEQYLQIRQATQIATTKDEYISALHTLEDQPMKVPVQWIRLQLSDNNNNTLSNTAFHELDVSTSVEQLWKDLLRDSVKFNNDEVLVGDAFHGPERIVGRLTQLILSSSLCDTTVQDNSNNNMEQSSHNQSVISEAQAIRYARDILLASNRTRSGGDSYYCAENLCLNRNMIVICPSSSEATPLSITVTKQTKGSTIEGGDSHVLEDVSGWVYARSSSSKSWKRQYIMLSSHRVLTYYAEALPKPHELIEQITLHGAKVDNNNSNNNSNLVEKQKVKHKKSSSKNESTFISGRIVHIKTKDGKTSREYLFEDEFDYLYWHDSLQQAANSLNQEEEANEISTSSVKSNGHHCNRRHSTPAVEVVVNVCTEYKIASMDPVGIESEDTWAKLRTTFVQRFTLTGGGDGRISRGDEVVQLELM